jgi:teichuronic acid biosynthesis glycosyltransferase TuaG
MSDSLSLSVVIPVFNSEGTIRRALDSILNQSRLPSRIIVIDDCSIDETVKRINEFIQESKKVSVTLIKNASNMGPGYSRNVGWHTADTEYVAFLDADDAWIPNKIETQLNVLEKNPEIDILCSETQFADSTISRQQDWNIEALRNITFNTMLFRNQIPTRSVILKRNIPFRFGRGLSEDYGLWLKCLDNGLTIRKIPAPLALHFRPEFSPGGLSGNLLVHEFYELRNLLEYLGKKPFMVVCAIIFSLLKFMRRIVITLVRRYWN